MSTSTNFSNSNSNTTQTRKRPSLTIGLLVFASFHMRLAQSFQASSLPTTAFAQRHNIALAYSTAADPPISSNTSFADRLRELGLKQQEASRKTKKTTVIKKPQAIPNMYQASSKEECRAIVQDKMDRLTVFRYYAPWCRACKKIAPRFDKMARDHPEMNFVQVPYTDETKDFIQKMGIASLPYGAVFHPTAGLVEQVNINPRKFGAFEQIVNSYEEGGCELKEDMINEDGIYTPPYPRHV